MGPAGIPITTIRYGSPTLNYYSATASKAPSHWPGAAPTPVSARIRRSEKLYSNRDHSIRRPATGSRRTSPRFGNFYYEDERGSSQNYPTYDQQIDRAPPTTTTLSQKLKNQVPRRRHREEPSLRYRRHRAACLSPAPEGYRNPRHQAQITTTPKASANHPPSSSAHSTMYSSPRTRKP